MELCCTYIETDKFDEVVNFYEKIFQIKGNVYTKNRWIEFDYGNKLAIKDLNLILFYYNFIIYTIPIKPIKKA